MYFPNPSTQIFTLPPEVRDGGIALVVEGAAHSVQQPLAISAMETVSTLSSISKRPCARKQPTVLPPCLEEKEKYTRIQVFRAKATKSPKGKVVYKEISQFFVKVSESTANVQFILSSLPKNWGKGFKLVTSDGLAINDSPGTQGTFISLNLYNNINLTLHLGVQFWKGRKVYAVNKCGSKGKERSQEQKAF